MSDQPVRPESELRDAISARIEADWEIEVDTVHDSQGTPETQVAIMANPDELAGSVLAMPEMQAIRSALRNTALILAGPTHQTDDDLRESLRRFNWREPLPESVIEWVIG